MSSQHLHELPEVADVSSAEIERALAARPEGEIADAGLERVAAGKGSGRGDRRGGWAGRRPPLMGAPGFGSVP